MRRLITLGVAICALTIASIATEATADETEGGLTRNPSSLSDSELDARLRFLEERIDAGETYTKGWQYGWTGGYALGAGVGTGLAIKTDRAKNRANHIVTASKAALGTTRMLLQPHPGRHGADAMRAVSGD